MQHETWIYFATFALAKNHKIAYNSKTTEVQEKISAEMEYLEFLNLCWTK
jgi:hypothetical protein